MGGIEVAVGSGAAVGSRVAVAVGAGVAVGAWVGAGVGSDSHAASAIAMSAIASVATTYRNLLLIKLLASRMPARRFRRPGLGGNHSIGFAQILPVLPLLAQIGQAIFNCAIRNAA